MTNKQIIRAAAERLDPATLHQIATAHHTPEEIAVVAASCKIVDKDGNEKPATAADIEIMFAADELHTFDFWKKEGKSVKKGEKALLECYLWKYTTKPSKEQREKAAAEGKRKGDYTMTANEEKNELVVVDVPNVQIYAFTVSGWPTPRTAEEVLNAARKSTAESIQRITQIIESGDYESDRGYWESRLAQEKARSYAVMTYGEWLDFEREKLLTPEMVEITKQDYENALNVLPPRNWHTRNNIEEFCSREMYSGTYTTQYAFQLVTGRYFAKMVDCADSSTWLSTILAQQ